LRRAEGGAKNLGEFRVKNHDFTPKNLIFFNCGGRREKFWGISCEKSRFYAKNHIFSNFRGRVPGAPLDPPLHYFFKLIQISEAVGWWSFFSILWSYMCMIVRLVDIVGIVDHHCLNFLFIVNYEAKVQTVMVNISIDINLLNRNTTTTCPYNVNPDSVGHFNCRLT
jgi:hypothetical protein